MGDSGCDPCEGPGREVWYSTGCHRLGQQEQDRTQGTSYDPHRKGTQITQLGTQEVSQT